MNTVRSASAVHLFLRMHVKDRTLRIELKEPQSEVTIRLHELVNIPPKDAKECQVIGKATTSRIVLALNRPWGGSPWILYPYFVGRITQEGDEEFLIGRFQYFGVPEKDTSDFTYPRLSPFIAVPFLIFLVGFLSLCGFLSVALLIEVFRAGNLILAGVWGCLVTLFFAGPFLRPKHRKDEQYIREFLERVLCPQEPESRISK